MLDLNRYDSIRLQRRPLVQKVIAETYLRANYRAAGVRIVFEGAELLPDEPVIFAMNHTDRFNFWPFQYELLRTRDRYTASWSKGKNYDNVVVERFMRMTNNIPVASRGYLLARDFMNTMGRLPTDDEYRQLRRWQSGGEPPSSVPEVVIRKPRDILGLDYHPERTDYASVMNELFVQMMARFVGLNERAHALGLDLLVFPQGGTSIRLSRGHVGLSQIALHLGRTIVPIACNGSDRLYPGDSPWSLGGEVVYRFGEPLRYTEMLDHHQGGAFVPFSHEADSKHRQGFQAIVDEVMDRIDAKLDERHRYTEDRVSDGLTGAERFVA